MNLRLQTTRSVTSVLARLFKRSKNSLTRVFRWNSRQQNLPGNRIRRTRKMSAAEQLEVRALLSTFTVTSTADSGAGTLRLEGSARPGEVVELCRRLSAPEVSDSPRQFPAPE